MARIRTVKPEFWTDEKVVAMSPLARLVFIGLWNFVDDEGRCAFSPARLKMQILPADSADFPELLGEIRGEGLISIYEVDGKSYLQVNGFRKHQKVDKRSPSKLPPPPNPPEPPRSVPPDQGREGIKEGDQGREKEENATDRETTALSENVVGFPRKGAAADYFFEGSVIKLTKRDFDRWKSAYSNLPNLGASLQAADDYYAQNPPADGKWFFRVSRWLADENQRAVPRRRVPDV